MAQVVAMLLLIQSGLPLLLAAWLWLRPALSVVGRGAQVAAVALIEMAVITVGLWLVVPWAIGALGAGAGAAAILRSLRVPVQTFWPKRIGWGGLVASALVAAIGLWLVAEGIAGRRPPPGPTIDLAWPLEPGAYAVANGGSTLTVNAHAETADLRVLRHRLFHGQSLALDIVGLGALGTSARRGLRPSSPNDYAIFGRRVVAPCAGTIVAVTDGEEDHRVPFTPTGPDPGNHALLRCGTVDVLLAHLARGTVAVAAGDRVAVGDDIGRVGNSGSSDEPHLHVHAQTRGTAMAPLSGRPLPLRLGGRWLVRGDRVTIRSR